MTNQKMMVMALGAGIFGSLAVYAVALPSQEEVPTTDVMMRGPEEPSNNVPENTTTSSTAAITTTTIPKTTTTTAPKRARAQAEAPARKTYPSRSDVLEGRYPAKTPAVTGLLARIRGCESGGGNPHAPGDYGADNPYSSASGAFQVTDATWRSWRVTYGSGTNAASYARAKHAPPAVQDTVVVRAFNAQGTRPWAASKSCWS
jgi:hypothetical protein